MAPITRVSNRDKHPGNILLPDSHPARKIAAKKAAIDKVAQLKQEMYEDAREGEEAFRPSTRSKAKITYSSRAHSRNQLISSKQEQKAAAANGRSHEYKHMKKEPRELVAEAHKQYYLDIEEDEEEQELAQNGKRKQRVVTYSTSDDERPTPKNFKSMPQSPVRGLKVEVLLPNWRAIVARDIPNSHLKQASKSHTSDPKEKKGLEPAEANNVDYESCGDDDVVADSEEDEEESNLISRNGSQWASSNVSLHVPTNGLQRASVNTPQNSQSRKRGPGNGAAGAQRHFGPLVSTQRKAMGTLRPLSKSQPRVTASSAQPPAKKPNPAFRIEDLPNGSLQRFREDLTPLWLDFVSTLENPWDVANYIDVMQEIWNMVFTDIDHTVQRTNDPVYFLLIQRAVTYRHAFSRRGETAVAAYLDSLDLKDPEEIAKYIGFLVPSLSDTRDDEETAKCYPFMWQEAKKIIDEEGRIEHIETKGAFCSRPISDTLALYLEIRESIPQAWRLTDNPCGALVLATASVERALRMYSTGVYAKPQNHLESRFSQKHWGVTTEHVMISVKKTSSRGWKKIIKAAMPYHRTRRTRKTRYNLLTAPERAREGPNGYTHCVDVDSASDSGSDIIF